MRVLQKDSEPAASDSKLSKTAGTTHGSSPAVIPTPWTPMDDWQTIDFEIPSAAATSPTPVVAKVDVPVTVPSTPVVEPQLLTTHVDQNHEASALSQSQSQVLEDFRLKRGEVSAILAEQKAELEALRQTRVELQKTTSEQKEALRNLKEGQASLEAEHAALKSLKLQLKQDTEAQIQALKAATTQASSFLESLRQQTSSQKKGIEKEFKELAKLKKRHSNLLKRAQKKTHSPDVTAVGGAIVHKCGTCGCPIACDADVVNKNYSGMGGVAYLYQDVSNVVFGTPRDRNFTSGKYQASDVKCSQCHTKLGWKYDRAYDTQNSEKVGHYCIGMTCLVIENRDGIAGEVA